MKTPTYQQIAAACGVSNATVSRALNDSPRVRPATRNHILRVANDMGWRPNPLASAYMAHLRSTHSASYQALLPVLLDQPLDSLMADENSNHFLMLRGFTQRAIQYGYQARAFSLRDPDLAPSELDRMFFNRNVPGFAIAGLAQPGVAPFELDWSRYAAVALGYSMTHPTLHRVATNTAHGFDRVITKAFELGYRRLGVAITRQYDERTQHAPLRAATGCLYQLPSDRSLDIFLFDERDHRGNIKTVATWLEQHRPDFAVGTWVFEAIAKLGWRIPDDIAFATFDRSPGFPEHAGLDQGYETSGRLAADILISEITHNRRGIPAVPVEHLFAGRWIDGPTAPRRTVSGAAR